MLGDHLAITKGRDGWVIILFLTRRKTSNWRKTLAKTWGTLICGEFQKWKLEVVQTWCLKLVKWYKGMKRNWGWNPSSQLFSQVKSVPGPYVSMINDHYRLKLSNKNHFSIIKW